MHNEAKTENIDIVSDVAAQVSSPVKTVIMTRMRHTTTSTTIPTATAMNAENSTVQTVHTAATVFSSGTSVASRGTRSPLRLQVPEDGLGNLSMVDAPAT